ncbi:aspartyl/asparaginyl beta-hydroxylase domain-containing protein [Phyllobacterium zundukense]
MRRPITTGMEKLVPVSTSGSKAPPSDSGSAMRMVSGTQLTRHADPIAISLRYHLGLATPNSDACFINVDGHTLSWRDGKILLFDETYLHFVRNDTDSDRLILMCDVKRPLNPLGAVFNFFYKGLTRASVVPNTPEDHRGLANTIFAGLARPCWHAARH